MTCFARRAALLVTFQLIIFAASASAECAWVLWKSTEHSGLGSPTEPKVKKDWEIIRADSLQRVCERVLESVWMLEVKEGKQRQESDYKFRSDDRAIGHYSTVTRMGRDQDWFQSVQFLCLPDTVDPRGPKEK